MNKKSYVSPVLLGPLDGDDDEEIILPPSQDHDEGPVNKGTKGYGF